METTTTRIELQERQDASLVLTSSAESLNAMTGNESNKEDALSMFYSHLRSGYNSENGASMSGRVFVLAQDGKPLTPCKAVKARKLLDGGVAKPIWNKFNQFGIQMLVETRKEVPKVILGEDWGTVFEGYSVISGKENIFNVMWKLPNKQKLVKKLEERRRLRKTRRFRNCRRRKHRFDNKNRDDFIAPSQLQIVNSRLKCMNELFKCYPINQVAVEDVKFNHRNKKWGKNFSTIEVGKKKLYDYIREKVGVGNLILFSGLDTKAFREKYNLKKSHKKAIKVFSAHCVDSFAIANELANGIAMPNEIFTYVDDNYRYVRRRLHDTQPAKSGIRAKFSTGNFKGIRKGSMCEFGQIVGGTKNQVWYCDFELQENGRKIYQKCKTLNKINWLSHHFKTKEVGLA